MQALISPSVRRAAAAGAVCLALAWALAIPRPAQAQVASEMVSFEAATARDAGAKVKGELRLPEAGAGPRPAVLVLHTSAGYTGDRISHHYIDRLNRLGIATLRINMFPDSRSRPRSTREILPHAYGSLLYLAAQPRIDPGRIGVLGFSYGGVMAILMASQDLTEEYTGGKAKFAAHLALYPLCRAHSGVLAGNNPVYPAGTYHRVTGAPVRILTGDLDSYDEPDSCPKFVAALPDDVRQYFAATVYPGAHHVFDEPGANRQHRDSYSLNGTVVVRYNSEAAEKAWAFAEQFFSQNLAARH